MTCKSELSRKRLLSPRVANAEKRLRISLLLDAYGELLTAKQRDFLRSYYEEDFSFGEIAKEASVSRQAVFDSVKHGEAALENYERVLGLVAAGEGTDRPAAGFRLKNAADRAAEAAARLRRWMRDMSPPASDASSYEELGLLAEELDMLAADLKGAGEPQSATLAGAEPEGDGGPAAPRSRNALVLGDGPEVD